MLVLIPIQLISHMPIKRPLSLPVKGSQSCISQGLKLMLTQGQVCGPVAAATPWELSGNEDTQAPPCDLQNLSMWGCWIGKL